MEPTALASVLVFTVSTSETCKSEAFYIPEAQFSDQRSRARRSITPQESARVRRRQATELSKLNGAFVVGRSVLGRVTRSHVKRPVPLDQACGEAGV
jgi:hypothetical protein